MKGKLIKKLTSVLSMALLFTMLLGVGSVFADETEDEDFVVTYSAEEITDVDILLEKAIAEQKEAKSNTATFSLTDDTDSLVTTQLTQTRLYRDGHEENDYIKTSFVPYDVSQKHDDEASAGSGGVAAVQQLSYTFHDNLSSPAGNYIQFHYERAKVYQKDSVVKIELCWTYTADVGVGNDYYKVMTTNASLNTWYTWNINSPKIKIDRYWGGAGGYARYFIGGSLVAESVINCILEI